jgi:hypothetical protein
VKFVLVFVERVILFVSIKNLKESIIETVSVLFIQSSSFIISMLSSLSKDQVTTSISSSATKTELISETTSHVSSKISSSSILVSINQELIT